jgi:ribonuclease P protein component
VFAAGGAAHHQLCSLRAAPNELLLSRAGIICGKRVGGAVERNRTRRRMRAALRLLLASLPSGWDILVVIRPPGAKATVADFVNALEDLLRRRGIAAGARQK